MVELTDVDVDYYHTVVVVSILFEIYRVFKTYRVGQTRLENTQR